MVALGSAGGLWYAWGRDLPSVSDLDVLEFSGQTRVYDRTGTLVGTLTPSLDSSGGVNRNLVPLGQIAAPLQKAVVTSEDRRFYEHHGVDYIGIARGLLKGLLKNDLEGGSSITQQVVKNTLLADLHAARTPERKFKEAVLAYQLDRTYDKQKILNAYLNIVYWGDGGRSDIVGAGTAAHAYFHKNAADLNLAESVYLATIIPAPNRRYKEFKEYRPLMKDLLARMVEDGRVTQAQANEAWKTPIYPAGWRIGWNDDGTVRSAILERPERLQENITAFEAQDGPKYAYQHYLQAVEKELLPIIGRKALYGGGRIVTGMSVPAQQAAEQASLNAQLPDGATLGIALVSPVNGEVLALVGQKLTGGRASDWNNATQARRQVGSSIKPLLYTLALQKGWKQSDTVLDSPLTNNDYQPQNYDGRWTGRYVTMRYALDHSLNLPTVRIGQEIGVPTFEAKLRELGLTPPDQGGLSLTIGTLEASPLQMAEAYAAFANGGLYYAPSLVRTVEDARGKVLYARPAPAAHRVWDAQTAFLGLDMIRGVVNDLSESQGGLATRALIPGWPVGGKTGTTNDIKDLWFAGVTPTVAGAVWVGKQDGGTLPTWAYSGVVPTPVWQQAVAGALQGQTPVRFQEPAGIAYRTIRQVDMAFRTAEADQEPVARDGSGQQGGFFTRRRPPAPESTPAPEPAAATQDATPDASTITPDPSTATPVEPVPADPTSTDSTVTDPGTVDPGTVTPDVAPAPDSTLMDTAPPADTVTPSTDTVPADSAIVDAAPPEALPTDQGTTDPSPAPNTGTPTESTQDPLPPDAVPPADQSTPAPTNEIPPLN
ncbi:peptidoglycan glycosyltransferase [Deinococcus sp. KSM4-11]|nr:peptidoglycan glycosyltransferase [Deinococcus sp. KSM4-11]